MVCALSILQDDSKHASIAKPNQQTAQWRLQENRHGKKNGVNSPRKVPTADKPEMTDFAGTNKYNPLQILSESQNDDDAGLSNEAASPAVNESYQSPTLEKPKGQSREKSMRTKPKHNQQNNGSNSTEGPIAILGDSMIKMLNPSRLRRSIGRKTIVKTFPGASVTDMKHYVKPTLEKNPELIVLHVGTNDIHQKEPEEIVKEMESLCTGIVTNSLAKVAISEIIQREDESMNIKIKNTNNLLAKLCSKYKWAIVQHGNINISNLNASGLHLNITGTATLAKNYINFLKH